MRCSASELMGCGLPASVAQSVASGCTFEDAALQLEKAKREGIQIAVIADEVYPEQLRQIYDPPPLLFARGNVELMREVMIAVVGSRRSSVYGQAVAQKLGLELSAAGAVVISGMARGIDTYAHLGALKGDFPTAAVFGCGVDVVYPAENRKLAEQIAATGLLLSEFPLGSPAFPQNFPVRNRIVSGLSSAVIVVEGTQYSGSSITARLALDQNREVCAVPGNITSSLSFGPNLLLKQGAHLIQQSSDVLEVLPLEQRKQLARKLGIGSHDEPEQQSLPLTPATPQEALAQHVLHFLSVDQGIHLDELVEKCPEHSPSELIAALFDLELAGVVRQLPGRNFVKVWT